MRSAAFRLLALGLGLGLALVPLGLVEARMRAEETKSGLVLSSAEPGRKYALDPDVVQGLNPDGFNDSAWARPKPEGTVRVALLGDSVAYGSGLPQPAVFPQKAEQMLVEQGRPVEILNLSIYGYDIEQVKATLEHRGWALEPDLIVYAWFTNDHIPTDLLHVGEDRDPVFVGTALPRGLEIPGQGLLLLLGPRLAMVRRGLGASVARHREGKRQDRGEEAFFAEHLGALIEDAQSHGVPLIVYGLAPHVLAEPDLSRCDENVSQGKAFCAAQLQRIEETWRQVNALDLPFVPALPYLRSGSRSSYYREGSPDDPHHPDAEGHLLLARGLADLISRHLDGEDLLRAFPAPEEAPRRARRAPKKGGKGEKSPSEDGISPSRASRMELEAAKKP